MTQPENHGLRRFLFSKYGLILVGFLAVAGYFLWAEHQAHILGNLPLFLILGVCVGMHFFMHGGHGGHGGGADADGGEREPESDDRRDP
jgi:hypothetical protein